MLEAAVRITGQTGDSEDSELFGLRHSWRKLGCQTSAGPGAFLEVACSAAAAQAAGISHAHAQLQLASLCFSTLKAAVAAAETLGADHVQYADACCRMIAILLGPMTGPSLASELGLGEDGPFAGGWSNQPAASAGASSVSWLALTGRVLLYLAASKQAALAGGVAAAPALLQLTAVLSTQVPSALCRLLKSCGCLRPSVTT